MSWKGYVEAPWVSALSLAVILHGLLLAGLADSVIAYTTPLPQVVELTVDLAPTVSLTPEKVSPSTPFLGGLLPPVATSAEPESQPTAESLPAKESLPTLPVSLPSKPNPIFTKRSFTKVTRPPSLARTHLVASKLADSPSPSPAIDGSVLGNLQQKSPANGAGSGMEPIEPRQPVAYRDNPKPPYPWLARRRSMEGSVVLQVVVDADGLPREITVKISSGHGVLDQAAEQAVQHWRFEPARQGGHPQVATVDIPLVFKLTD